MNEIIGNNIMILRKEHGLTQEQLANALGISYQAVSKWETGNACPDISTLPLLADQFSVSVDQLIGRVPLMGQTEEFPENPQEQAVHFSEGLPWPDDNCFYAVLYHGHELIGNLAADPELEAAAKHFVFQYEGPAQNIDSDFSVEVEGEVFGSVTAGRDVNCDNVGDSVCAGRDVNCDCVGGGVEAGGSVDCDDVGGSVSAGMNVDCDDVGGDVTAGMTVRCDDVSGKVSAGFSSVGKNFVPNMDKMSSFGEQLGKRISAAVQKAIEFGSKDEKDLD